MDKSQVLGEIIALAISNRLNLMSYLNNNQIDLLQILNRLYELELISENKYNEINNQFAN